MVCFRAYFFEYYILEFCDRHSHLRM
jgi:hypothetical protein